MHQEEIHEDKNTVKDDKPARGRSPVRADKRH